MIEQITGKLIKKTPTFCVMDWHGMGLGIHISVNTFQKLDHNSTAQVSLFTHLHVREDDLQLYGFAEIAEKEMFRMLISISGIGPRLALTVLSGMSTEEIQDAIARNDVEMLTRIPGVGRKTAQRLILELREKIQARTEIEELTAIPSLSSQYQSQVSEAVAALLSLGYRRQEARRAIDKVLGRTRGEVSLEEMIKLALKEI